MKRTRQAFTLVELMMAIGIIIILAGILLVVVSKSMATGRRVRAQADLQSIATALEAYRQDFGDYPRPDGVANSAQILCRALVGPDPYVDGQPGPGFRIRPSGQGKVYGPYIDLDKFDVSRPVDTSGNYIDGNNPVIRSKAYTSNDGNPVPPILYIPKNIRPIQPQENYVANNANAMYDTGAIPAGINWPPLGTRNSLPQMQYMMGNKNQSNPNPNVYPVTGNDVPAFTGPYILWMAGPDGIFGLTNSRGARDVDDGAYTTDDITNFNFDPAITVK